MSQPAERPDPPAEEPRAGTAARWQTVRERVKRQLAALEAEYARVVDQLTWLTLAHQRHQRAGRARLAAEDQRARAVGRAILAALTAYALQQRLGTGLRSRAWESARRVNAAGTWPGLPEGERLTPDQLLDAFGAAWALYVQQRRPAKRSG